MDNLKRYLDLVERGMAEELAAMSGVVSPHLYSIVKQYLEAGGKRLRPCLLLACCEAVGGDVKSALPAAIAVEMYHNWTLIHDDVIDHDDFRRGRATGHRLGASLGTKDLGLEGDVADDYGKNAAILAGDVLQARATEKLFELQGFSDAVVLSVVREMTGRLTVDLLNGEQLDVEMSHLPFEKVDESMISKMMLGKTSALLRYCSSAGAALGCGEPLESCSTARELGEFAALCGLAFQLKDDLLGIFGDERRFGKPIGSDIREGKRTLLACKALVKCDAKERERFLQIYGSSDISEAELELARKFLSRGVEATQETMESCVSQALEILEKLEFPSDSARGKLVAFAESMVARDL
jgi:geranylgeranyl diphosphate synthase type I